MTDVDMQSPEYLAQKNQQVLASMEASGQETSTPVQQEYYGTDETYKVFFPDGVTYVECKYLNEGDRSKFQGSVNKELRLEKVTGDALMKLTPGSERKALLMGAIVDWNLIQKGKPVPFSTNSVGSNLAQWIEKAPPSIIDMVEKEIRKHEPWTMANLSSKDIQEQIDQLQEMLEAKVKEEAGKDN